MQQLAWIHAHDQTDLAVAQLHHGPRRIHAHAANEALQQQGIVFSRFLLEHEGNGLGRRHGIAGIRAVAQVVERIGDTGDAGEAADPVAPQLLRITAAVQHLVVHGDDVECGPGHARQASRHIHPVRHVLLVETQFGLGPG